MKLRDRLRKLSDSRARSQLGELTEREKGLASKLRGGGGIVMKDDVLVGADASVRSARQQFEATVIAHVGAGRIGYEGRFADSDRWPDIAVLYVLSRPEFAADLARVIENAKRPAIGEWAPYTRAEIEAELETVRAEKAALVLDVSRRDAEDEARAATEKAAQIATVIDEQLDELDKVKV